VTFGTGASQLRPIILTVRLEDGEALAMILDTGSPVCSFDFSLKPKLGTFIFQQDGDACFYHYTVRNADEASPWQLERVWRTDQAGQRLADYPVQ